VADESLDVEREQVAEPAAPPADDTLGVDLATAASQPPPRSDAGPSSKAKRTTSDLPNRTTS